MIPVWFSEVLSDGGRRYRPARHHRILPRRPDGLGICCTQQRSQGGRCVFSLAAAKKTAEFKIYPGAPHGFHADYRASYRKEAAEDAWSQMQAWFKKYKVLG